MALSNLSGWADSACGASDKPEEKPVACGSACGASDKPEEKPAACGTACGAGDK
ncbi:MAG TPA: ACGX-repeat peptide [Lachnospiraceae bacterium]|nr:ACGX-repeat peptide [Lachnospiraceae bacterium]